MDRVHDTRRGGQPPGLAVSAGFPGVFSPMAMRGREALGAS